MVSMGGSGGGGCVGEKGRDHGGRNHEREGTVDDRWGGGLKSSEKGEWYFFGRWEGKGTMLMISVAGIR